MALTDEEKAKLEEEFNAIPEERTFCTIKLYLNADNAPEGTIRYTGDQLKKLGVSEAIAIECQTITHLVHHQIQETVARVGNAIGTLTALRDFLGGLSDNEDSSSEGSGPDSTNTSSVPGDSEAGDVRPVGRPENATDSTSH